MRDHSSTARVTGLFRAFSDLTRLRILHLLRGGELCVGDIVSILQLPQPAISRHLSYLRRAGLVSTRRKGLWTFYALTPARGGAHEAILSCLGGCFREVPEIAKDIVRAKKIRRAGGCCPK